MRRRAVIAGLALAVAGCGSTPPAPKPLAPVRLTLETPSDRQSVAADTVAVQGRVWPPSAQVLVGGREATVVQGAFSASVALVPGSNVIDVVAGAHRRPAAMTAIRVTRIVDVRIPDLTGMSPDDAVKRLHRLGLQASTNKTGGIFDDLLPGSDGVCATDPAAGTAVPPGSKVVVDYSKTC